MSRLKRSRALLRNLRKQARKGTLSAREQQTLLSQEKKFRKAARRRRRGIGAGIGAALGAGVGAYLASPAFAALLERGASKEDIDRAVKAQGGSAEDAAKVNEAVERAPEGSSPEQIVQEVEEQVAPSGDSGADAAEDLADQLELDRMDRDELLDPKDIRGEALGDDELIRDLEAIEEDPEAPIDDELARASLMDPAIFEKSGQEDHQDGIDGMRSDAETGEVSGGRPVPAGIGASWYDESARPVRDSRVSSPNQRSFIGDALADLAGRSLDDPRIEALRRLDPVPLYDYVAPPGEGTAVSQGRDAQQQAQNQLASERMQDALDRGNEYNNLMSQIRANANTFRPMDEFGLSEEADIPLEFGDAYMPLQGIEEFDTPEEADIPLEDFPRSTRRERAAMAREAARARNRARRAGEDGIPVRSSGPRVQAMGGKNPKMADLMKKVKAKYGIR